MAVNSLGPNYPDVDYMQRDGTEGSGSGAGPDFDEEERDDEEGLRGSGSGDGPGHDGNISYNVTFPQNVIFGNCFEKQSVT
nr:unnamed protein product [Callosobruchus chinensis]